MNNKHTATPWEILEDIDSTSIMKDGFFVALCAGYVHGQRDTDKANAAFIVRACNAHDDLVKSATTFNEIMEPFTSLPPFEAMTRFKELCASGGIDILFFELARAAKASKAALAKATHE